MFIIIIIIHVTTTRTTLLMRRVLLSNLHLTHSAPIVLLQPIGNAHVMKAVHTRQKRHFVHAGLKLVETDHTLALRHLLVVFGAR